MKYIYKYIIIYNNIIQVKIHKYICYKFEYKYIIASLTEFSSN